MIPSAGQGILAVQGRKGEDYGYLDGYCDRDAWIAGTAERAYVKYLDGGCSSPVAAFAEVTEMRSLSAVYITVKLQESGLQVRSEVQQRMERSLELHLQSN